MKTVIDKVKNTTQKIDDYQITKKRANGIVPIILLVIN